MLESFDQELMKFTTHFLLTVFLTASVGCATAANNQVSPSVADLGATSNSSNNQTSIPQKAAPDQVVKELYDLHQTGKSPLHSTKRALFEKYFSTDFVILIWTNGKDPNLINKLAIENDILYGAEALRGQIKNLNVGKAQVNGKKAVVSVTYVASDEGSQDFTQTLTYEMVEETGGWRISDVKCDEFYSGSLVNLIKSLKNTGKEFDEKAGETSKPPFIGKKWFVTAPGNSGAGTPQHYLTINSQNLLFCGFVQTNQASGEKVQEEVALGKFKTNFECNFKNEIGGNHFYQIKGNYIYELDANMKVTKSADCCKVGSDSDEECECKGEFVAEN